MKRVGIHSSRARLEHARIIDGLGTPARVGSLAVKDGRIEASEWQFSLSMTTLSWIRGNASRDPCAGQSDPVTDPVTVREIRFLPSSRR